MSLNEIRRIKLLRDLESSDQANQVHSKSETKKRFHSTSSVAQHIRKLNKNKKYMLQEERNTEIQRNNRLLYQKIMGHFQSLKQTMQSRNKWCQKKKKIRLTNNQETSFEYGYKKEAEPPPNFRSRVQPLKESTVNEIQTLFFGWNEIDGYLFKTKLLLSRQGYRLIAQNKQLKIELQMQYGQYMKLQRETLEGNPCNIFKYLQIVGGSIRFRQQNRKSKTLV